MFVETFALVFYGPVSAWLMRGAYADQAGAGFADTFKRLPESSMSPQVGTHLRQYPDHHKPQNLYNDGDDYFRGSGASLVLFVAIVCVVWYLVVMGISLVGTITVFRRHTTYTRPSPAPNCPGVTILRPMKGIDCEMEACLGCVMNQDYPVFEVLFCVESAADAAVAVAQALIDKYPSVDCKILVGAERYGPNPKINNLAKGYAQAKYDLVWVLDANVWVSPGALRRSVAAFDLNPQVALVHHLPIAISVERGWHRSNLGAKLDEMFLATAHSKFYTAINVAAIAPCVVGKSNLYKRSQLDRVTKSGPGEGIRSFAKYIAEDNMIADALWQAGGRTAQTSDSVVQPLAKVTLDGYVDRRMRWLRVRKYMVMAATVLEPTTESIVIGILGSFGFAYTRSGRWFCLSFFAVHMVCWALIDYWHFHNLIAFANIEHEYGTTPYFARRFYSAEGAHSLRPVLDWLPIWLLREALAFPIWVKAMLGQTVMWRNRPFRILPDMSAEEVTDDRL